MHNRVAKFIFNPVAQYWSEMLAQFVCEINTPIPERVMPFNSRENIDAKLRQCVCNIALF
jgi:hypothetical protein